MKCPKCFVDTTFLGHTNEGYDYHCTPCQIDIRKYVYRDCDCTNPDLKLHPRCTKCGK